MGQHLATILLKEENSRHQHAFTRVYGPCDRKERKGLWKELAAINGIMSQPWAVGGDFNVLRFEEEKRGRAKNTTAMRELSKFIHELSLIDLPFHGGSYTWFRGRNSQSASMIDSFFIIRRLG